MDFTNFAAERVHPVHMLTHSKDHIRVWIQKFNFELTYPKTEDVVSAKCPCWRNSNKQFKLMQENELADSLICIFLSNDMRQHVPEATSACGVLENLSNRSQRDTLQNQLKIRCEFYTAKMKPGEQMWNHSRRVSQLRFLLKSMSDETER